MNGLSIPGIEDMPHETADERYARRRRDPQAHAVAVEQAAQAYATFHGWDWPSLSDYPVPEGMHAELVRLEARQKIRYFARIMVEAFECHLQQGGQDREAEARQRLLLLDQLETDTTRRLLLKPKPFPSILSQRKGD